MHKNSTYIHNSDVNGASRRKLYIQCFFGEIVRKHFVKSKIESGTIKLDISGTKEDFFFFGCRLYVHSLVYRYA